ncbi:hypothetical protein TorRG33x02_175300 [Trema orientale]|uniref:Rx N-terminal domain-containing protein n=1 Tax=Trema orientale TaxID=63057 RepID=A0A2P5EM96_TREOI|nr:hypothetical protein TorRG33x02_175300 [Trema orientale]
MFSFSPFLSVIRHGKLRSRKEKNMAPEKLAGALLSAFLKVMDNKLDTLDTLNLLQGEILNPRLVNELKIKLLSVIELLNDSKIQLEGPNPKRWLERLKQVVYESDRVMHRISAEALRLMLEKGKSDRNACQNFSPQSSPVNNDVTSEIHNIFSSLKLLFYQTKLLGGIGVLSDERFWYSVEGRYNMVYNLYEPEIFDHWLRLVSKTKDVRHRGVQSRFYLSDDDEESTPTCNDINGLSFSSGQISFFSDDIED